MRNEQFEEEQCCKSFNSENIFGTSFSLLIFFSTPATLLQIADKIIISDTSFCHDPNVW
jgi:hypothetical protein